MNYGSENIKFDVIRKNGKPFVRMTSHGTETDMMVWKAKTDAPYVKYMGMVFYLDEELKKRLA